MTYNDLSTQKTPNTKPLVTPAPKAEAETVPATAETASTAETPDATATKA